MQDVNTQTPPVEIDRSADATPREGHQAPPPLNSFQLKQSNENIIVRLMQTGLFQSKQHLLQAALMCLFADMQRAFKQTTAAQDRAKWREEAAKEQMVQNFMEEHRPLMEDLAAAEEAEKAAQATGEPNTNLQD